MKKIILILMIIVGSISYSIDLEKKYYLKVIDKNLKKPYKYSVTYIIPLIDGDFPSKDLMESISFEIIAKNTGYDRYFIHFLLPGMKYGEGAYAIKNFSYENMDPLKIQYSTLTDTKYKKYVGFDKEGNFILKSMTGKDKGKYFKSYEESMNEPIDYNFLEKNN